MKHEIQNNENTQLCAECGGKCCKHYGGFYHPSDFDTVDLEPLSTLIDEGGISIDWYNCADGSRGYFLRARHVGGGVIDPSFGGQCVHLTETGCDLPFEKRPYGCRRLVPSEGSVCKEGSYKKLEAWHDWEPYMDILVMLEDKYSDSLTISGNPADEFKELLQNFFFLLDPDELNLFLLDPGELNSNR